MLMAIYYVIRLTYGSALRTAIYTLLKCVKIGQSHQKC